MTQRFSSFSYAWPRFSRTHLTHKQDTIHFSSSVNILAHIVQISDIIWHLYHRVSIQHCHSLFLLTVAMANFALSNNLHLTKMSYPGTAQIVPVSNTIEHNSCIRLSDQSTKIRNTGQDSNFGDVNLEQACKHGQEKIIKRTKQET